MHRNDAFAVTQPGIVYDYIIAGTGLAGLSIAKGLLEAGLLRDKKLLLIDPDPKTSNDRTWCFWEKEAGPFEKIVHKQWSALEVIAADGKSISLDSGPYRYKLIKGSDFYNDCFRELSGHENIYRFAGKVSSIVNGAGTAEVHCADGVFKGSYVFSSLFEKPAPHPKLTWLLQHFRGWRIRTATTAFDPAVATLMDFRTPQDRGTAFFYLLPFSTNEALVEYTVFSEKVLPDAEYNAALQEHITRRLGINDFEIEEVETGVIPMTNYKFPGPEGRIIPVGTAGGRTKGSSGYTFRSVQKHTRELVDSLRGNGHPFDVRVTPRRFTFYDSVLLQVLASGSVTGASVFSRLFSANKATDIFPFLDNESDLRTELKIIATLPVLPFTKAAIQQL
jgi:lycopene beta-cyclase